MSGVSVPASFGVSVSTEGAIACVRLTGEIDLQAKPRVRADIGTALSDPAVASIVVDLTEVTFLDSSGISALIGCRRMADERGKALRVIGAQGQPATVLALTGVGPLLAGEA
jgi:anti-sigma B factor antagonist